MANHRHNPSFNSQELCALVLKEVPELEVSLPEESRANPHRVMSALFQFATQAINNRAVTDVVRCFRLTKQLVELRNAADSYVNSAVLGIVSSPVPEERSRRA
jgi:hypothetical protein